MLKPFTLFICLGLAICCSFTSTKPHTFEEILSYQINPKVKQIGLYWRDGSSKPFNSLLNLKTWLASQHKTLLFAMNGGMYQTDYTPLGLLIQNGKQLKPINTAKGKGNFYMEPNGIFYIDKAQRAFVCNTSDFKNNGAVSFATQSGPMLVINGAINPLFKAGSDNLNVRNGVGILPNGEVLFAMSKQPISFYDFATFFKSKGCTQALYLDGFVSRTYLPEKKWEQLDGNFGVIIGVTEP
ncbi:MAG: phosphodiester glycosidase family protein [Chitinophagales bacterium]|nr:phosphodiester glycosidase family protein [Chitinophagales bacterium]